MTPALFAFALALIVLAAVWRGDDAALLRRIAQGDARALRALYRAHAGKVMAVAGRILGSRAEAEEIAQDTFVEVWRRSSTYDPKRGAVGAWVALIARSRALDRLRSRASSGRLAVEAEPPGPLPEANPVETVERRQARDRVRTALGTLSEEQRLLVELAFYEGLSHSELASRTQTPLGTVKGRLRRALALLETTLAEVDP
jgi:RNA polymerase sigma-70 factor (ECF subfamily)